MPSVIMCNTADHHAIIITISHFQHLSGPHSRTHWVTSLFGLVRG